MLGERRIIHSPQKRIIGLYVIIMEVRELRLQTGLSQSKFAKMFDVPVSTLKDWEQERRKPPAYVINMMRTICTNFNNLYFSKKIPIKKVAHNA